MDVAPGSEALLPEGEAAPPEPVLPFTQRYGIKPAKKVSPVCPLARCDFLGRKGL
jgi:hypothetical protein